MSFLQSLGAFEILLSLFGAILVYRIAQTKVRKLPLPPGPKPLPFLGNLRDMPTGHIHLGKYWAKHKELYGPISSVSALGTTLIIVNDSDIAFELLEKRSSKYSSRPSMTFCGDMVGFGLGTTISPYGDTLRQHRKWMQSFIGSSSAMESIENVQEIETCRLLYRLLETPDNLMDHLHIFSGAIILKITYGYTIDPIGTDHLVALVDEVDSIFSESAQPGRWLVDTIPALRYMPDWFPGAGFKKTARKWNKIIHESYDKPFAFVKRQIASGYALPSFVENILQKEIAENEGDSLKYAAATLYAAGAETTAIAMATFYLAMTLYPAVLKRAQEEIDRVIGDERLPSFADYGSLPYVTAILKEVLRWEVILPAGIPHSTTEEDNYDGYHIPKGAVVIPNIWQMTHDPERHQDPFTFNPERFLGENGNSVEPDPSTLAFGFGRRICPGMEVAQRSLFLAIATSTAVFNISKAKDVSGKEIEPLHEYFHGLISFPKPFQCSIMPRSEKAVTLTRAVLEEHPFKFENGDGDKIKDL